MSSLRRYKTSLKSVVAMTGLAMVEVGIFGTYALVGVGARVVVITAILAVVVTVFAAGYLLGKIYKAEITD